MLVLVPPCSLVRWTVLEASGPPPPPPGSTLLPGPSSITLVIDYAFLC